MTAYKSGEVLLVPFPFTDLTDAKQRPAVVLSSSHFNQIHQDVIIAAITSHLTRATIKDDYQLTAVEQVSAGLPKPSIVKLGKVTTLDQRLIRRRLGRLPPKSMRRLIAVFSKIFQDI